MATCIQPVPLQQQGKGELQLLRCVHPACCAQQILDKEEFTLEELLDEDDIIQECKSLNGRLITL
jgi:hypothetical protein